MFLYILFQLPEYAMPPTRHTDYSKNREYLAKAYAVLLHIKRKVKLKVTLVSVMKAIEEVEVYLHHSSLRNKMEVRGQLHSPDALPPVPIGCVCVYM
jgi:hypothetical protein